LDSLTISESAATTAAAAHCAAAVTTASSDSSTTEAVNALITAASINPQLYAMLSAHQALQWQQQQQQHQQQHRSNPPNQPYATSNDRQQMIATNQAATAMQNCHNLNTNTNGTCSSCRELKRELEHLRQIVLKLMENKPDLLCASQPLFGLSSPQRSVIPPQSFVTDSPFSIPVMSNLPSQLFRYLANMNQSTNQNIHLPQVEHNWPAAVAAAASAAAAAAASASTSGNTTDLAQNATSVENNVDNNFVDSVGIEGSETSSSTSSANTQAMISPRHQQQQQQHQQQIHSLHNHQQQQQHHQGHDHLTPQTSISNSSASAALSMFNGHNGSITASSLEAIQRALNFPHITNSLPNMISSTSNASFISALNAAAQSVAAMNGTQQTPLPPTMQLPLNPTVLSLASGGGGGRPNSRTTNGPAHERGNVGGGPIVNNERRKASTDDFVKNIRQCQMTDEDIRKIEIPVPEALKYDQNFRPASEEQIIQQIMTSKKYETMDVQETMIQLCKKLAEKRVFGSRLMADTTVAAPNHSNYTNLPDKGIIYILHVCKKVLGPRVKSEDEFWEYFRDAMRKLAARCRRVRHAKKVRSQNHYVLGNSNSNTMVTLTSNAASPSIFTSAQTLVDDERSSRSSTASNPSHTITSITSAITHHQHHLNNVNNINNSSNIINGNRPFTPLSTTTATLTPSSSNTSPTQPDGASPKST
jgi:hypothetical protein